MIQHCHRSSDTTVWLLDGSASGYAVSDSMLGADERARLTQFLRAQRRHQFLLGRLLLRHALCRKLAIDNSDICISERPGSAPLLHIRTPAGLSSPYFSLSHSHDWIACAISTTGPLGIDIEDRQQARNLADPDALAAIGLDAQQLNWLQRQPNDAQRLAAFYRLWTCTEALFKLGAQPAGTNCRVVEHAQLAICLCSTEALTDIEMHALDNL